MAKTPKNTIKSWFLTDLFPTQTQFHNWLDSFWHKDEAIPMSSIEGLSGRFDDKLDAEALPPVRPMLTVNGNLFYFVKNPNNNDPLKATTLEANDFIAMGAWSATEWWDKAIALGTNKDDKDNWKPLGAVKGIPQI